MGLDTRDHNEQGGFTRRTFIKAGAVLTAVLGLPSCLWQVNQTPLAKPVVNPQLFKDAYTTAVLGADTLFGGNIASPAGGDHFIADQYTSGEPFPAVYNDLLAEELRKKGGAAGAKDAAKELIARHHLMDAPAEATRIAYAQFDLPRAAVIGRTMDCMHIMLRLALAQATGDKSMEPTFDERYTAATGEPVRLVDPAEARERLARSLIVEGQDITRSQSLAEAFEEYQAKKAIKPEEIARKVPTITAQLLELTRRNVLSMVDFGPSRNGAHMERVAFDGQEFKVVKGQFFTGSSAYYGGKKTNGDAALRALFEYNGDHPLTASELLELIAHETMPGHYFQSSTIDTLRQAGRLGFETSIATMCTGESAFQEGWGQVAQQLAFGGTREDVVRELGGEFAVDYAANDLQDAGKNNAAILVQRNGVPLDTLRNALRNDYALPIAVVKKLSGAWATHTLIGPMYGPAYQRGKETMMAAIKRFGPRRVTEVGLHTRGYVDLQRFKEEVAR